MTLNKSKILAAIADCNRYIAKEGARSADLRPADIQKLLDWYIAHRANLLGMLDAPATEAPVGFELKCLDAALVEVE